ncbi:MAG: beta-L-arabinofuranosidase domain-containing protein, partial [Leeuwenhoekiella sp.]
LTGWNSLMTNGLVDAYRVFNDQEFLDLALKNANFIKDNQLRKDGGLNRNYKEGKSTINAYLEDYAATIEAYINLFEVTSDEKWLNLAQNLTKYTINHFYNPENGMFYFTSDEDSSLITRSIEYMDNVIPASNSIMAKNLFKLSHLTFDMDYNEKAAQMLHNVSTDIESYPSSYSNWLDLTLNYTKPFYEIVIAGKNAKAIRNEMNTHYIPNAVIASTETDQENIEVFEGRWDDDNTWIYVCVNNACKLPVKTVNEALKLLEN